MQASTHLSPYECENFFSTPTALEKLLAELRELARVENTVRLDGSVIRCRKTTRNVSL